MDKSQGITPASILSLDAATLGRDRQVLEVKFHEEVATHIAWMHHPYAVSLGIALFGVAFYQTVFSASVNVAANATANATAAAVVSNVVNKSASYVNMWRGVGFAVATYLLVCSWQLRDSLLVRPHPVFWRVIKGLAFLYVFGLIFYLFQDVGDARRLLSYWDPALGVPLEERSYATHCEIWTPGDPVSEFRHIYDALFDGEGYLDTFILCHVIGWLCKMIMIRDIKLTLAASVLFEIYEITFAHMLENFKECWWDAIILDIIICNGLGMLVGWLWLRFWKCTEYNFLGYCDVVVESGGQRKVVQRWKPLVSFRYFMAPVVVLVMQAAIELNAFFLKYIVWVPPPHHLNLLRVIFWWLLGCAGLREWYHWVNKERAPLGTMICLIFATAFLEILICFKFGAGMFPTPAPPLIRWSWTLVLAGLALFAATYFPVQHFKNAGSPGNVNAVRMEVVKEKETTQEAEGAGSR